MKKKKAIKNKIKHISVLREIPRPFKMFWGSGEIIEEASFLSQYHEPSIQLMKYENGSQTIRFCYYQNGAFQRGPLILDTKEIKKFKRVLNQSPKLKKLLKGLF